MLLNAAINANGGPLSLDALIAAYPKACIYNFPNPTAGGITPTPAVDFYLGDSRTITDKKLPGSGGSRSATEKVF